MLKYFSQVLTSSAYLNSTNLMIFKFENSKFIFYTLILGIRNKDKKTSTQFSHDNAWHVVMFDDICFGVTYI